MNKKIYVDSHEEALDRLCFVCGELCGKRFYLVGKYLDFLSRGLKCAALFEIPGITPINFCQKCYLGVLSVTSGRAIHCARLRLLKWVECSPDCSTCSQLTEMKTGRMRHVKKVCLVLL